jgi:hypothetical protein
LCEWHPRNSHRVIRRVSVSVNKFVKLKSNISNYVTWAI